MPVTEAVTICYQVAKILNPVTPRHKNTQNYFNRKDRAEGYKKRELHAREKNLNHKSGQQPGHIGKFKTTLFYNTAAANSHR